MVVATAAIFMFPAGNSVVAAEPSSVVKPSVDEPAIARVFDRGPMASSAEEILAMVAAMDRWPIPTTFDDPVTGKTVRRVEGSTERLPHRFLTDHRYEMRPDGSMEVHSWQLTRIIDRDDIAGGAEYNASYSPWHEDRPEIHGRVITPGGEVITLDPSQTIEQAEAGDGGRVISDRRQCVAMLSGCDVGSIIEWHCREVIRPTLPGIGCSRHRAIGDFDPYRCIRVRVTGSTPPRLDRSTFANRSSADDQNLGWTVRWFGPGDRDGDEVANAVQSDGRTLLVTRVNTPSIIDWYEPSSDHRSFPTLQIAHCNDWQTLGRIYGQVVDNVIEQQSGRVESFAQSVDAFEAFDAFDASSSDPITDWRQTLQTAVAALADKIRYTGWSLGDKAIYPATPDKTISRRYGDCKDQSTLLVAMLRRRGIDASIALVRSGGRRNALAELPSTGHFDHAIVAVANPTFVTGPNNAASHTFIDPTMHCDRNDDGVRFDYLSPGLWGRSALVCDGRSGLVQIPTSKIESFVDEDSIYTFDRTGQGTFTEICAASGPAANNTTARLDQEATRRLRRRVESRFADLWELKLAHGHIESGSPDDPVPSYTAVDVSEPIQMADRSGEKLSMALELSDDIEASDWFEQLTLAPEHQNDQAPPARTTDGRSVDHNGWADALPVYHRRGRFHWQHDQHFRYGTTVRVPADVQIRIDSQQWSRTIGLLSVDVSTSPVGLRDADAARSGGTIDRRSLWIDPTTPNPTAFRHCVYKETAPEVRRFWTHEDRCVRLEVNVHLSAGQMTADQWRQCDEMLRWAVKEKMFDSRVNAQGVYETGVASSDTMMQPTHGPPSRLKETVSVMTDWFTGDSPEKRRLQNILPRLNDLIDLAGRGNSHAWEEVASSLQMQGLFAVAVHLANDVAPDLDLDPNGQLQILCDFDLHRDFRPTFDPRQNDRRWPRNLNKLTPSEAVTWLGIKLVAKDGTLNLNRPTVDRAFGQWLKCYHAAINKRTNPTQLVVAQRAARWEFENEDSRRTILMAALVARRERELIPLAQKYDDLAAEPIIGLLRGDQRLPGDNGSDGDADRDRVRTNYLMLISAERFGLAQEFAQRHADQMPESWQINRKRPMRLGRLDPSNLRSAARWMVVDDMLCRQERLRSWAASPSAASHLIMARAGSLMPSQWCPLPLCMRSESLAHFVADRMHIETTVLADRLPMLIAYWPHSGYQYGDGPYEQYRGQYAFRDNIEVPNDQLLNAIRDSLPTNRLSGFWATFDDTTGGAVKRWQFAGRRDLAMMAPMLLKNWQENPSAINAQPIGTLLATLASDPNLSEKPHSLTALDIVQRLAPEESDNEEPMISSSLTRSLTNTRRATPRRQQYVQLDWMLRYLSATQTGPEEALKFLMLNHEVLWANDSRRIIEAVPPPIRSIVIAEMADCYSRLGLHDRAIRLSQDYALQTGRMDALAVLYRSVYLSWLPASHPMPQERRPIAVEHDWAGTIDAVAERIDDPGDLQLLSIYRSLFAGRSDEMLRRIERRRERELPMETWLLDPPQLLWVLIRSPGGLDPLRRELRRYENADFAAMSLPLRQAAACAALKLDRIGLAIQWGVPVVQNDPTGPLAASFIDRLSKSLGIDNWTRHSYSQYVTRPTAGQATEPTHRRAGVRFEPLLR